MPNSQVSMASGARECAEATPSIRHERQEIVLCQISRPTAPALTWGPDWMANDQGYLCYPSRAYGCGRGCSCGSIWPDHGRTGETSGQHGEPGSGAAVGLSQDREPGSWADCSGEPTERAGLTGNGPSYLAPDRDSVIPPAQAIGPRWQAAAQTWADSSAVQRFLPDLNGCGDDMSG